jgi:hypothetical protein
VDVAIAEEKQIAAKERKKTNFGRLEPEPLGNASSPPIFAIFAPFCGYS